MGKSHELWIVIGKISHFQFIGGFHLWWIRKKSGKKSQGFFLLISENVSNIYYRLFSTFSFLPGLSHRHFDLGWIPLATTMSRHENEYQNGSHHWNEPTKDMGLELGKENSFQNYCHLLESQILGDCQIGKRYIQEISALYGLRAFFSLEITEGNWPSSFSVICDLSSKVQESSDKCLALWWFRVYLSVI